MTYVVTTLRGIRGTRDYETEYLAAIRYDRYRTGDTHTHDSTPDLDDAFKFQTLEAAYMAAVFIGGQIKELDPLPPGVYVSGETK